MVSRDEGYQILRHFQIRTESYSQSPRFEVAYSIVGVLRIFCQRLESRKDRRYRCRRQTPSKASAPDSN